MPERERVELQRSVGRMLFALDHAIARRVTLSENGNPLHAIRHRYHGLSEQVVWLLEDWERTARYSEILPEYREAAVVLRADAEEVRSHNLDIPTFCPQNILYQSQAYMPPTEFSNLCTGTTCMVDSLDRATERIAWSRAAALVHNIRPAYFALYNHVNTAIQTHVGDTQHLRQQQEEVMQLLDEAEAKVSSGI